MNTQLVCGSNSFGDLMQATSQLPRIHCTPTTEDPFNVVDAELLADSWINDPCADFESRSEHREYVDERVHEFLRLSNERNKPATSPMNDLPCTPALSLPTTPKHCLPQSKTCDQQSTPRSCSDPDLALVSTGCLLSPAKLPQHKTRHNANSSKKQLCMQGARSKVTLFSIPSLSIPLLPTLPGAVLMITQQNTTHQCFLGRPEAHGSTA